CAAAAKFGGRGAAEVVIPKRRRYRGLNGTQPHSGERSRDPRSRRPTEGAPDATRERGIPISQVKGQTGRSGPTLRPFVLHRRSPVPKQTPLNAAHRAAGARMVDFGGWDMPVNYGSQIDEHRAVRTDVGMFDVSHMLALDVEGAGARDFLRYVLAN